MDVSIVNELVTFGFWFLLSGGLIWLFFQDAERYYDREKSLMGQLREKYQKGEISKREFEDVRKTMLGKH